MTTLIMIKKIERLVKSKSIALIELFITDKICQQKIRFFNNILLPRLGTGSRGGKYF